MAATTAFTFNPFTGNFDFITVGLGPSDITGGTPNTFAGWDSAGVLESIPNWNISTDTGGAAESITLTPSNPGGGTNWVFNNFNNSVNPTANLTNLSFQNMVNTLNLFGPFDHTQSEGMRNEIYTVDTGSKGNIIGLNNRVVLGDGSVDSSNSTQGISAFLGVSVNHTASGITGFNSGITVDAGATVNQLSGQFTSLQIDGDVTSNPQIMSLNLNLTSTLGVGVGLNGLNVGGNISGTAQYTSPFFTNMTYGATSVLTNGHTAFGDNTVVQAGASLGGYFSFAAFPNFDAGSDVAGYVGLIINPNMNSTVDMTGAGFNGVSVAGQLAFTGNYSNTFQSALSFNSGAALVNDIQTFNDNNNVQSGASANSYTSLSIFPNIHAGATIPQLHGMNLQPDIDIAMTDVRLMDLNVVGSGSATNLSGISVNVSQLDSPNQKNGLSVNGGATTLQSPVHTDAFTVGIATSGNNIGGDFQITAGFPLTGGEFVFGNNLAFPLIAQDDMDVDITGGAIGYSNVAFVSQTTVALGKTVDTMNLALAGLGLPTFPGDGGTITNLHMYRAIGALPQGGNLIVDNMYAFRGDSFLSSASPTNLWGISIEDATAENFFQKSLAIGTASKKVTLSTTGLEVFNKDIVVDGAAVKAESVSIVDTGSGFANSFSSPTLAADVDYILPAADGTSGQALTTDGAGNLSWADSSSAFATNLLINGNMEVAQRGVAGVPPTTNQYGLDRWLIENTSDDTISPAKVNTTALPGSRFVLFAVFQSGGTTGNFHIWQILDSDTSYAVSNSVGSFAAQVLAEGNVTQVGIQFYKEATTTIPTSPIGSEVLVTINPTTYTKVEINGEAFGTVAVGGCVGVRIRPTAVSSGNIYDAGNGLRVGQTIMTATATAQSFYPETIAETISKCLRFYKKSYDLNTNPGTLVVPGPVGFWGSAVVANAVYVALPSMHVQPTVVLYDYNTAAINSASNQAASQTIPIGEFTNGENGFNVIMGAFPVSGDTFLFHYTADAEIY